MRVLHVIWHLGQGGAQTYLLNLLKQQLADPGVKPKLLILGVRGSLSDQFEQMLNVSYLNMRNGLDLTRAFRIRQALRQADVHVIHSHCSNLAFNASLQFLGIPVVYTEHGGALLGGRKRNYLIYRGLSRPINRFIAISKEMAKVMSAANPSLSNRIDLVYNGVNIEDIASISAQDCKGLNDRLVSASFRVGIVCRLEHQKGVDLFLAAAAEICRTRSDVVFVIVGDGSLREQLEELARTNGISGVTFFLGYRTDALRILKMFDVFLFTSNYEPFGLVITEAMTAGVPVVAVHTQGAIPEIISHGIDGLVVHSRNPRQLADAVNRLISEPSLRSDIIVKARETVRQRFTIQTNSSKVKAVYEKSILSAAVI